MYGGTRFLKVHGGLTQGFEPTSGLIAGCARAKDFLQSLIGTLPRGGNGEAARIYVDDITLTVTHTSAQLAAEELGNWGQEVKLALHHKFLVTNLAKEQVFARREECAKLGGALFLTIKAR
jgi:hypothetical protein